MLRLTLTEAVMNTAKATVRGSYLYYLYRLFLEGGRNAVKQWSLFE